jgi:hypothetical protein
MNTLLAVTGEILVIEASSSTEKLSRIIVLVLCGDSERPYELAVIECTPDEEKLPVAIDLRERLHPMPTSVTISSGLFSDRDKNILRFCFGADDIEQDDDDDVNFLNPIFTSAGLFLNF